MYGRRKVTQTTDMILYLCRHAHVRVDYDHVLKIYDYIGSMHVIIRSTVGMTERRRSSSGATVPASPKRI